MQICAKLLLHHFISFRYVCCNMLIFSCFSHFIERPQSFVVGVFCLLLPKGGNVEMFPFRLKSIDLIDNRKAEAMVTPRRKYRRPAMVTPKSYPYP